MQGRVILVCGRLCVGKSTYAKALAAQKAQTVVLSADDLMLCILGPDCGEAHDMYAHRAKTYLLSHGETLVRAGVGVILDWGFWRAEERRRIRRFFAERQIGCSLHYVDIDDETHRGRIRGRNAAVRAKETLAYYVDEGLLQKAEALFEAPDPCEVDVYVRAEESLIRNTEGDAE